MEQNKKINGHRFNETFVATMPDFNAFFEAYKGSAYTGEKPDEMTEAQKQLQRKRLEEAWSILRPTPATVANEPAATSTTGEPEKPAKPGKAEKQP